jgi:hypothetical protein
VNIFVLQGNEYRKMPFRIPRTKYCEVLKSYKKIYQDLAAASNLPPTLGCPVATKVIYFFSSCISFNSFIFLFACFQGLYIFTNYFLDVSSVPKHFDGRFKMGILFYYFNWLVETGFLYVELRNYD